MADTSGEADIRGIDIDKLAKGFADEEIIFKRYVRNSSTSAREIRWYQKTAGYLDTPTTTGITTSNITNTSFRSLAPVAEQSWTRQTSYIRKYFVESPTISDEDIKDSDIDILATNVRDLVRGVQRKIDARIYSELSTGSGVQSGASTGPGWNQIAIANPILDLETAKQAIRAFGYNPMGAILAINSIENKWLVNYLINVKGSSVPSFSSSLVEDGIVMEIMGLKVVVSENATTDQALVFVNQRAAVWKSFSGITTGIITDVGIGKKIRVWEEGELLLTDPKACYLITNTIV